ncbi:phage tail assembly chaperone [Xylella fastidiosa]|uniref:phage tail assembly chaperone n=1 Tax=Xylella fastidiosa TaxID=2371 RepID=UPI00041F57ED|nr:putative phage tail assembly chaperone [Xylella fastidiosa]
MALGTLLSHLGDPAVTEIEALVFEQTAIKTPEGTTYRLSSDRLNEHFNTRRTHLLRVLMEGVKYQYSDFFVGGMAAFQDLIPMPSTEKE